MSQWRPRRHRSPAVQVLHLPTLSFPSGSALCHKILTKFKSQPRYLAPAQCCSPSRWYRIVRQRTAASRLEKPLFAALNLVGCWPLTAALVQCTVEQLKVRLVQTVNIPPERQRLIFRGRVLGDRQLLTDAGEDAKPSRLHKVLAVHVYNRSVPSKSC